MSKNDCVQKSLRTILKKGDLYDTIALREGVSPQKNAILKNHLFSFSRILYGTVMIYEKIQSILAPIAKVRQAHDQIRSVLGVNVDIIRSKTTPDSFGFPKKTFLSLLYENSNIGMEDYIKDLKKILNFCESYNIKEILLRESDITGAFIDVDINEFSKIKMKNVLNFFNYQDQDLEYRLLSLSQSDLIILIQRLELIKTDKKFILELCSEIEDITIMNAVSQFFSKGDLESLKAIVNHRLTLHINNDSAYRDKENGKVFENVNIKEEFIRVTFTNNKGEHVNDNVITLYDYLDVLDFNSLLNHTKMQGDNKGLFLISALYLYLCNSTNINKNANRENISFYDRAFNSFQAKRKGELKKIPSLFTRNNKRFKKILSIMVTCTITLTLCIFLSVTGMSLDLIQKIAYKNPNSTITENIIDGIFNPYRYSFNMEMEIVGKLVDFIGNIVFNVNALNTSQTGDSNNNSSETVGTVLRWTGHDSLPTYFAEGFANGATYSKGQISFDITQSLIRSSQIKDVENSFVIIKSISKSDLQMAISNNEINLLHTLYPVGGNYVLSSLRITDMVEPSKRLVIDGHRASISGNKITNFEAEMLKSMKKPEVYYIYGISYDDSNSFVESFDNVGSYSNLPVSDVKAAITTGLGLESSATIEEIFLAIQNKNYSKTPIRDAGLTREIKRMNEKEYFECVASLDSLICNMAATLAVEVDQDLIYTVGYYDDGDGYILKKEAHAWAMNASGEIIDITPSGSLEDVQDNAMSKAISSVLKWGFENNIPLYAVLAFIGVITYKIFGKKVKLMINVKAVEKILTKPDIETSYAKIKESLYGGVNIPCERTSAELITALNQELSGVSVEELRAVKKNLSISDLNNDKKLFRETMHLIEEIPFIRENGDTLQLTLQRKSIR